MPTELPVIDTIRGWPFSSVKHLICHDTLLADKQLFQLQLFPHRMCSLWDNALAMYAPVLEVAVLLRGIINIGSHPNPSTSTLEDTL